MKRILVVDDEPELAHMLGEELRSDGYEVVLAGDGEEGLRKARITQPDLIILDVMMPKLDGAEVYAKLRANKKTKDIPVIFLTALKSRLDDFALGRDVGNYTIFSKPFDHGELLGTIREFTEAKRF